MHGIRASVRGTAGSAPAGNSNEDLNFIVENANTDFEREITTHRGGLGKLYLKFRKWVYREHRLSAGPVIEKQSRVNRAIGEVLASQQQRIRELEQRIAELESRHEEKQPGAPPE